MKKDLHVLQAWKYLQPHSDEDLQTHPPSNDDDGDEDEDDEVQ